MIQFNLLPDVKKEYVKAKRTKRLITTFSIFASAGAIVITVLMFSFVNVAQKTHMNGLTDDIKSLTSEIQSTEDLDTILTVQNQLTLLSDLHKSKPETSRLFDFITFVSPAEVNVSTMTMDVAAVTAEISGTANSIATVNKLADNLKAVRYFVGSDRTNAAAPFTQVLTNLSGDNTQADFKIVLVYDPIIFDNTQDVVLQLGSSFSTPQQTEPSPQGEGQ